MSLPFRQRSMAAPETLGERLHQLRDEAQLSIEDVSRKIHVASKYLRAIEESRYHDLPGRVYAGNFVRLYAQLMNLNAHSAIERFHQEYRVITSARPTTRPLLLERAKEGKPWVRRHARSVIAVSALALLAGYFSWQVVRLITPPPLTVVQPAGDMSTKTAAIIVSGQTQPGAKVTINNQPVDVNPAGQFQESIDVQPGLNTLKISAIKKYSHQRTVVRQVVVQR